MTWRGILLGLLLALFLSLFTYYNDWVVVQHGLVGGLLPVGVFGVLTLVILLINPLLRLVHARGMLQPRELVIVVVLGLAACSYPGGAFSRLFAPLMLLPGRWMHEETSWQSVNILSYVPGGSAELGEGHVRDWVTLCRSLTEQSRAARPNPGKRVLAALSVHDRQTVAAVAKAGDIDATQGQQLRRALNKVIDTASLYDARAFEGVDLPASARQLLAASEKSPLQSWQRQHLNRALLCAVYPKAIRPVPAGSGVLLLGGRSDPKITDTTVGGPTSGWVGLFDLPWAAWWPVIRLWGGLFLLLAVASFCIVLIVHPQWSRHEVLPYPIVQIAELMIRREEGRWLPDVTRSKLFWYGFGGMVLLSLVNGLHSWFPAFPLHIPTRYSFYPLMALFPNARHVPGWWGVFNPFVVPIAVAFAYFLNLRVSFSLGISMLLWMAVAATLVGHGIAIQDAGITSPSSLMLFGAGVGFVLAIFYYGRRHYWDVMRSALGRRKPEGVPAYCVWAMRWLVVAVALAMWLMHTAGVDWLLALLFIGLTLMVFLIIARVNAETGALMVSTGWMPTAMLLALLGNVAIGPSAFIVLVFASFMFLADMDNPVMAQLVNAICLVDRTKATPPRRTVPWVLFVLVAGLAVSIAAVLLIFYNLGTGASVGWWAVDITHAPFNQATKMIEHLSAWGQLQTAMSVHGLSRLSVIHVQPSVLTWIGVGFGLMVLCLLGYLLIPGWPLHPVLFVFWGTFPAMMFHLSFLLGWAIKAAVVRVGGSHAYQALKPLMVGVIGGQLFAGLMWLIANGVHFAFTHQVSPMGKSW